MVQYTKDFSFENPNAPRSLGPQSKPPNIAIQVNVNVKQIADTDYEVELLLEGTAGEAADTLFKFELNYAGLFRLLNIPEEDKHPIIMIECPRLLFPFARQIVADAVRAAASAALYRSDRFRRPLSPQIGRDGGQARPAGADRHGLRPRFDLPLDLHLSNDRRRSILSVKGCCRSSVAEINSLNLNLGNASAGTGRATGQRPKTPVVIRGPCAKAE